MNDLELAATVAREAGALLRERFEAAERRNVSTKSTPTDLVSEADVAAERSIRERLRAARPEDGILGEEGSDVTGTSGRRWIVDPLDGTVNFLFGIPQWAVSIAVEDREGTLAGIVHDPMRDESWCATRDGEATLNDIVVEPSARADLAHALVATGFGYDAGVRDVQAATVARLLPLVRDIRRLGSAALDLAWTSAGRYDAFYERGIQIWDSAAGAFICARAGLEVRRLEADPPAAEGLLVAPPGLADALEAVVA